MAQINKPSDYFRTKLYSGQNTSQSITFDESDNMSPDWVWIKSRNGNSRNHCLYDNVRGVSKRLESDTTIAENSTSDQLTSFDTNGFTVGIGEADINSGGRTFASWNWLAAGTAPSKTYVVKVVDDSGNKYRFDDFGTSAVTLEISEGGTFRFDQADSSNSGHPLRFSTTSDGTHGGGSEYTTGVTTVGTPGSAGAYTEITVAASAPTLYYYCSVHSGMGGQANTPTTNSFSNFDGTIQTNISPNTTAGFSVATFTGNGTGSATIGHGLGSAPKIVIIKNRGRAGESWQTWFDNDKRLNLNSSAVSFISTNPISTSSTLVTTPSTVDSGWNTSSDTYVMYSFAPKKGYSKFGTYTGNGNADGTFVYTGFKPAWIMIKRTDTAKDWLMHDNKRIGYNPNNYYFQANLSDSEGTVTPRIDFLSNGWKLKTSNTAYNESSGNYIYMAFAEEPLVGTNNIPATAR